MGMLALNRSLLTLLGTSTKSSPWVLLTVPHVICSTSLPGARVSCKFRTCGKVDLSRDSRCDNTYSLVPPHVRSAAGKR